MKQRATMPRAWWVFFTLVLMTSAFIFVTNQAEAANGKSIVGAWYVDTVGAPFEPHGITFHADGTLDLTNPDAAEATNSSSAGMGAWLVTKNDNARGRFFEVNADKTTNQFTSLLVVTFEFTVSGDTFTGPATASYYDGNRNLIAGPFPATLKGQRFTVDGPIPDPLP
jgi:hypothetical protein